MVVGGGQTPGETIGNGRATALLLAREGARVVVADRRLASADETLAMIRAEGGEAAHPRGQSRSRTLVLPEEESGSNRPLARQGRRESRAAG